MVCFADLGLPSMPPYSPVDPTLVTHLTDIRAAALAAHTDVLAAGPDPTVDVLGAIAWRAAWPEARDGDRVLAGLVEVARSRRFTWREIAVAVGESNDRAGETRTQARQAWRRERLGL